MFYILFFSPLSSGGPGFFSLKALKDYKRKKDKFILSKSGYMYKIISKIKKNKVVIILINDECIWFCFFYCNYFYCRSGPPSGGPPLKEEKKIIFKTQLLCHSWAIRKSAPECIPGLSHPQSIKDLLFWIKFQLVVILF